MAKRVTVTALAVVATVVTFYVAQAVDGVPQIFAVMGDPSGSTIDMQLSDVLFFTVATGAVAWILASVLDRVTKHAKIIWSVVALAVLLVSMIPVFQLDLDGSILIWQILLHLVFGVVLIGYWLTWPSEDAST